jgi:molybdate transport system permease protein
MYLSADEIIAVKLSLRVALVAVFASLPAGIFVGWFLAKFQFPGKSLVETVVNIPLTLPPIVSGYLLLLLFGRNGYIGHFLDRVLGLRFIFDWKGAALAASVMAFPLMVRSIRLAFSMIDPRLELAARTLGAGKLDAFFTVSLPLAIHGIIAGAVLAFARSLGEFGATIMIAGNIPGQTRTIPLYIYNLLESPDGIANASRLVIVAIFLSAGALFAGQLFENIGNKRLEDKR